MKRPELIKRSLSENMLSVSHLFPLLRHRQGNREVEEISFAKC